MRQILNFNGIRTIITGAFTAMLLIMLAVLPAQGQSRMTRQEYIDKYKDAAIQSMRTHGIPASITLAQGCLESGDGNSDLAVKANNHFGIKCHKDWKGPTYYKRTMIPANPVSANTATRRSLSRTTPTSCATGTAMHFSSIWI